MSEKIGIQIVDGADNTKEELTESIRETIDQFTADQKQYKITVENSKLSEKQLNEFGEAFDINVTIVDIACEKVWTLHKEIGQTGVELAALAQVSLFNVLGAVDFDCDFDCKSDIWSVLSRADLALEIFSKAEDISEDVYSATLNDVDEIVEEVRTEWNEIECGDSNALH